VRVSHLRPTIRGIVALVTFGSVVATAIVTGTPELAPLAVVMGVPLVVSPWLAHRRARSAITSLVLHAHVEPGAVGAGEPAQVKLSVTNRATAGTTVPSLGLPDVADAWRASGTDPGPDARVRWVAPSMASLQVLVSPAPGATEPCFLPVPTGRRGVFTLRPQQSWVHDPFGFVGAPGPVTPVVVAVVHPVPLRLDHLDVGAAASPVGSTSTPDSGPGNGLGELEGLRPYVAGDRLSLLHWPAKIRYGTWFVRQFDGEGTTTVSIVLDDRAGVHRRIEFERLVSVALWSVLETSRTPHAAHLMTLTGRSYSFAPGGQGRADARLVLAGMQPVALPARARTPMLPVDALVLTTRTGAERLAQHPPVFGSMAAGGLSVTSMGGTARIVVV
jgi:uncharacterized protein (DUF58 family)